MAKLKRILLTLGAAAALSSPLAAQINAEQITSIGRNVLSMDDYMLAIQYFNMAIKAKPYVAEPYFLRAMAKMNLEDFLGAEEDCSLALERNKYLTEAYRLRGYCRSNLDKDSLALMDFDAGLKYQPEDKYFLYYKSISLMRTKHFAESDSIFSRLLQKYPDFDDVVVARSRVRMAAGDTVGALHDIDRCIEIDKDDINNYLIRAEINFNRQNWNEAAKDLDEAIRLDPKQVDLYINRAFVRYNLDDYNGTINDYNIVLQYEPNNLAARYNRALLTYELRNFRQAYADFTVIVKHDPNNFHARYNHALLAMDLGKWRDALDDFQAISKRYPRFYPVYYGIAQCQEKLGNHDAAIRSMLFAEDMVRKYVDNPRANPLDRPKIEPGKYNSRGEQRDKDETDEDVMSRFNRLITVAPDDEPQMQYEDRIKGKVQDRKERVEPQPLFAITIYDTRTPLRPVGNYFSDLESINKSRLLPSPLYLANTLSEPLGEEQGKQLFALADDFTSALSYGSPRPIDLLGRGVTYTLLKNYHAAVSDFDQAISLDPKFAPAYIGRAYARHMDTDASVKATDSDIISDLDRAIELSPRLVYAWYNKGTLLYEATDYPRAEECFTRAIEINPDFPEAYFNRALVYLAQGDRDRAFADLSRAGELGVLQAYSLMKSMK